MEAKVTVFPVMVLDMVVLELQTKDKVQADCWRLLPNRDLGPKIPFKLKMYGDLQGIL